MKEPSLIFLDAIKNQLRELNEAGALLEELMNLLRTETGQLRRDPQRFQRVQHFVIDENEKPILIDFPQMISTSHYKAEEYNSHHYCRLQLSGSNGIIVTDILTVT